MSALMHAHRYVLKGIVQVKRRMSHLTKRVQSINILIKSVNDIYRRGRYQMFEYCTNGSPPQCPSKQLVLAAQPCLWCFCNPLKWNRAIISPKETYFSQLIINTTNHLFHYRLCGLTSHLELDRVNMYTVCMLTFTVVLPSYRKDLVWPFSR